jgi:LCP family protein required for cell wall assembly
MNDGLRTAFALLERRGERAGAETVAMRALAEVANTAPPKPRSSRWMIVAGVAATVALLIGVVYVRSEARHLRRIDVTAALGDRAASYGSMNVLVVGSDSRTNESAADLIMVVRLNPSTHRVTLLSIPRDLWVHIPGSGDDDRLSNAFGRGASALIGAVRQQLGIDIDHFVQIDFRGFRDLVSIAGGVRVPFVAPARDVPAGLDVPAGCVSLDGDQALAFVRSRHFETLEDGRWRVDPTGDLGRIQRQQFVVRQLVVAIGALGVGNPLTANRLVNAFVSHTVIDSGLSTATLLRLARDFHTTAADAITMLTLPTKTASVGGAVVLQIDESSSAAVLAALSGDESAPTTHDASTTESANTSDVVPNCR